jgi:hypothetical protein
MDKRSRLGRSHFPIAILADAGAEISLLRPLPDDKRRTAPRIDVRKLRHGFLLADVISFFPCLLVVELIRPAA